MLLNCVRWLPCTGGYIWVFTFHVLNDGANPAEYTHINDCCTNCQLLLNLWIGNVTKEAAWCFVDLSTSLALSWNERNLTKTLQAVTFGATTFRSTKIAGLTDIRWFYGDRNRRSIETILKLRPLGNHGMITNMIDDDYRPKLLFHYTNGSM